MFFRAFSSQLLLPDCNHTRAISARAPSHPPGHPPARTQRKSAPRWPARALRRGGVRERVWKCPAAAVFGGWGVQNSTQPPRKPHHLPTPNSPSTIMHRSPGHWSMASRGEISQPGGHRGARGGRVGGAASRGRPKGSRQRRHGQAVEAGAREILGGQVYTDARESTRAASAVATRCTKRRHTRAIGQR